MKRTIALLLAVLMLLTGCTQQPVQNQETNPSESASSEVSSTPATDGSESNQSNTEEEIVFEEDAPVEFASLSDPDLLQYVEDNIYTDLTARFNSDDYIIESVNAVYVSEEYL